MTWFHWLTDQFCWPLAHIEYFCFCLNVSSDFENQYPAVISKLTESPECYGSRNRNISIIPGFGNFATISKSIGNKDFISLMFISSYCLGFWTVVRFSSSRQRASDQDNYLIFSHASFLQCPNYGLFFFCAFGIIFISCYLWYWAISLTLKISLFLYGYFHTRKTHEIT